MSAQPTMPTLTPWQLGALHRYARDFDKAQRQHAGRIIAVQALAAAKRALTPAQFAVIDFTAGRGMTVSELARRSGRNVADLCNLLSQAATFLARHYEAQGALEQ